MPLIQGKSKKAFDHNLKAEMSAGKPKDQSLAISYSVQRKNKRKMAKGGSVDISAASEKRPMPSDANNSEDMMMGHPITGSEITSESHDFAHEERPSIDRASITPEEMGMIHRHRMAKGGEVERSFDRESMSENSIDDSSTPESMNMLDSKPRMHKSEKRAASGMPSADDSDDMEMSMMHQKGQPDEYSKRGIVNYARGGEVSPQDEIDEMRHASVTAAIMAKRKRMAEGGMADGQADLQDNNGDEHLNMEDQLSYDAARKKTYYDLDQLDEQPMDSNERGHDIADEDEHSMVGKIRSKMKMKRG